MGFGLFATRRFTKGDFIAEYTGEKVANAIADKMPGRYLFELDDQWTIDGSPRSNTARYINHSCDPNCDADVYDGHILIHAMRDIESGEELLYDYGDEYFEEFIRKVGCKCKKCTTGWVRPKDHATVLYELTPLGTSDKDAREENERSTKDDLND